MFSEVGHARPIIAGRCPSATGYYDAGSSSRASTWADYPRQQYRQYASGGPGMPWDDLPFHRAYHRDGDIFSRADRAAGLYVVTALTRLIRHDLIQNPLSFLAPTARLDPHGRGDLGDGVAESARVKKHLGALAACCVVDKAYTVNFARAHALAILLAIDAAMATQNVFRDVHQIGLKVIVLPPPPVHPITFPAAQRNDALAIALKS
jgi:hypothetical protein